MNPELILKNVQESYRGFESYSDVGTVNMVPPIGKTSLEFRTYFEKPSKMRFEWRDWHPYFGKDKPANESVVWSADSEQAHMWFLGNLKHSELMSAVAGTTGVSSASVLMILNVLLPKSLSYRGIWFDMRDISLLEDEKVNGFSCFHLVGTTLKPNDREAWISKDDLIVRRLRAKTDRTAQEEEAVYMRAMAPIKKAGKSIERPDKGFSGKQYYYDYNYDQVAVNQPLSDDLFSYDPSKPPDPRYVR